MTGRIERIRVFIEAAQRRSFSSAARTLGMTRSQVTRYISELEADIGARLLTRTTRQVSLTAAGRLYLDRAGPIVAQLAEAEEQVRQQQQTLKGDLRVSVPLSFGLRFLPDLISQFRILYPDVRLKLNLTDRLVDVASENYDMALRISGPPTDKTSIWRKIRPASRVLIASPSYLARKPALDSPRDFHEHDRLVYAHGVEAGGWELRHARSGALQVVESPSCFACNSGDLIGELAVRGEGVALLPRFIVAGYLNAGALVEVLPDWKAPDIFLSAFYPPYDHLPAKVQTFTNFLEDMVSANGSLLG
jgi:DNA-binding transcriptional LysR family regulator